MKNLEIKIKIDNLNPLRNNIKDYYVETLTQKDTYYHVANGRLKLREENTGLKCFIRYYRNDSSTEKISNYHFYHINNKNDFDNVFADIMRVDVVVDKTRELYLYKNARIHLDTVANLGTFVEIEVVIKTKEDELESNDLFQLLMNLMNLNDKLVVQCGYRELLLESLTSQVCNVTKDLHYYASCGKVFWVISDDINDKLRAKQIVPCIFVEKTESGKHAILQLDESIKFDNFKYTAWRKLIGETYNIWVDVLLIDDDKSLYTLNGTVVEFASLQRSSVIVDKSFLAKFQT